MGAAISALIEAISEIAAAIAAGASTVAAGVASAAEAAGLLSVTTVEIVELAEAAGGVLLDGIWVSGIPTYSLTALGTSVLAAIGLTAGAGIITGISLAAARSGNRLLDKITGIPSLLQVIGSIPNLACIGLTKDECRRKQLVHSSSTKRTVRIYPRESKQRTMLSYASPSRVDNKRQRTNSTVRKVAKSRKISKSTRPMRKQSYK